MDSESLQLLEDGLRKTMTAASGQQLDAALADLGWLRHARRNAGRRRPFGVPAAR